MHFSHYSQLSLRRTPLGPALSVRLREMSILQRVKYKRSKERQGPTLGVCFTEVSVKRESTVYWCRCVNISFTFHYSIILMASLASLFRKHCTCTSVLQEMLEIAFPRPSIQKFSGEACPQSPLG